MHVHCTKPAISLALNNKHICDLMAVKIQTAHHKHSGGMANSVDPNQTAPFRSSLIWIYNICSDTFAPILMVKQSKYVKLQIYKFKYSE